MKHRLTSRPIGILTGYRLYLNENARSRNLDRMIFAVMIAAQPNKN
jgi:hypothetical protein